MIRAAVSKAIRHVGPSGRRSVPLATSYLNQGFHASSRREEKEKAVEPSEYDKTARTLYNVGLGIAFAVPAIHYEWYIINEETQLLACFIVFCGVFHQNFGPMISSSLDAGCKAILNETNSVGDVVASRLESTISDLKSQQGLVEQLEIMKTAKEVCYTKMNETGKVKPLYKYKGQVEKMLAVIAAEEAASKEKTKVALMEEATAAVYANFSSSKDLQKKALANAVSSLKGETGKEDPVKDAYLAFFAKKKDAASKIDEKTEIMEQRKAIITKLNTVAMTEKFYFAFDAEGKPKMSV